MAARRRTQPQHHHSALLEVPKDQTLRVVVVADTHSMPHPRMAPVIRSLKPDAILHAGDIGSLGVLEELRQLAPLIAVRGNIDERNSEVPDTVDIDIREGERSLLKLILTHIAVYGPKLRADAARLAAQYNARMVICGHSHVPFMGRDKGLVMFNPGSIGPRRGYLPVTMGLLEVAPKAINLRHFSCETGGVWSP